MYSSVTATNPRKRAAPGATSPKTQTQQIQQPFPSGQMSNEQYVKWGQNGGQEFLDPTGYNNLAAYGVNGTVNQQYQQSMPGSSTQLARRPGNHHLVSTVPRASYDTNVDPRASFGGDDQALETHNGVMEDTDNVEVLEERAIIAKRDATSKRKQIPPFVQKLSR